MLRRRGWLTGTLTYNPDFTNPSPEEGLCPFPITPSDSSIMWCPFLDHSSTSFGSWRFSWFCSSSCTSYSPVPFKNWDGNNSSGTVDADKCLLSGKQTTVLLPCEEVFWPGGSSQMWFHLRFLDWLFIARLEMMFIIVTNIMMLRKPACKAQTAALFTNIINEVIFNINSSEPAFLTTLYGLGHRAIRNFYSTSTTGLPPRFISFG